MPDPAGFKRSPPGKLVSRAVLTYKKVWFSRHALDRMKQRTVSEEEVFQVLASPDKTGLKTQKNRFRWRKNRVDVVFKKLPDRLLIITVIK